MRLMCLTLFVALTAMAQVDPEYVIPKKNPFATAADLKNGQQLFMGQCARCHGSKGEGGRGAVLAQPRLRHAPDDESLFMVIRDGIKGTEMPGGYALDTRETWQLAAYVRSLGRMAPETIAGDPKHGEEVYRTKGRCAQCHINGGQGGSLGPELTEIGCAPQRRALARSGPRPGVHFAGRLFRSASGNEGWPNHHGRAAQRRHLQYPDPRSKWRDSFFPERRPEGVAERNWQVSHAKFPWSVVSLRSG